MSASDSQEELTHKIYKACKTIACAGASPEPKQLQLIMLKEKKGFFSCLDQQSPESNKQVLEAYGVNADDQKSGGDLLTKAHDFRSRLISSKAYHGGHVLATVIPKATMERKINGIPSSTYLWAVKHIVTFLRIGVGLEDEKNGCQLAKPNPNLDKLLSKAARQGICGVKLHSRICDANEEGIQSIVNQQFIMADKVRGWGLVPLIEPQIDAKAKRKEMCEELLLKCIMQGMKDLTPESRVIFSLSIPTKARLYKPLCDHPNTLRVIAICSREEGNRAAATKKISENAGLCASFGRSFLEGLKVSHTDEQFNQIVESSCDSIYKALR
jgi:fructose-bisphosphate aldolase class I